jgi:diguanylate cyclase (GGDEF)-like protein
MADIVLEVVRAVIIGLIFIRLVLMGRKEDIRSQAGWLYVISGFGLIFFGMLIDITDNFPVLNRFVVVGNTSYEAFLEKVGGYLLGFSLLAIGFWKWMPTVIALREAQKQLKGSHDELELRVQERTASLRALNEELQQEISERKSLQEKLHAMSITDELTGLLNRRGFFTHSQLQLRMAQRMQKGILLFFADVDDIKGINDTLGHHEGDRALTDTAHILKDTFRASDIIARLGGDEFAALMVEGSGPQVGNTVRDRLNKKLDALNREGNRKYRLSLSMGVVHCGPDYPFSIDDLLRKADETMYLQKKGKKPRTKTL